LISDEDFDGIRLNGSTEHLFKKKEMQNNQPEAIWRAFFHNSEGILLIYKFSKLDIHCTSDGIRSLCFNCSDPRATHAQAQPF